MKKRWFLGLFGVAALGLLLAPSLSADPVKKRPRPWQPIQKQFSVSVEDVSGRSLPVFHHRGQRFVMGSHGQRYSVRLRNHTSARVEAVVSVDGRDAISGRIANFSRERGYVIPAHGSVRIDGFRRNLRSVAAFRFTSPSDSYSSRRGTPQNVGVIGAAFFTEKKRRPIAVAQPRTWSKDDAGEEGGTNPLSETRQ